jgi:hypothetical protein
VPGAGENTALWDLSGASRKMSAESGLGNYGFGSGTAYILNVPGSLSFIAGSCM